MSEFARHIAAVWGRRLAVLAVGLVLAVIVYYGVIFTGQLPDHRLISGWNDTLLHMGSFGLLALLILPLVRRRFVPLLALIIFAAAIEAAQAFEPQRTASLSDFAAGLLGIALSWFFLRAVQTLKSRMSEKSLKT